MGPGDPERRLAAILSADAVGYSRLMAQDEAGTIRTVTAHRRAMESCIERERGRVVDAPGAYAMGLTFMRRRKSSFIHGAEDDARELSAHLAGYLDTRARPALAAG